MAAIDDMAERRDTPRAGGPQPCSHRPGRGPAQRARDGRAAALHPSAGAGAAVSSVGRRRGVGVGGRARVTLAPAAHSRPIILERSVQNEPRLRAQLGLPLGGVPATRPGVWGVTHIVSGQLGYRIDRLGGREMLLDPERPWIVAPEGLHQVDPDGPVRFFMEFHCTTG
ncbi:DUF1971 domain-containing protein [Sorangium sp. So ce1128]